MLKKLKSLHPGAIPANGKPKSKRTRLSSLKPVAAAVGASLLAVGYFHTASASSTAVYLAQAAAGSGDGSSCANARAASWFNSSSNWGTGSAQIGAGTTVYLCGTVSTSLSFQGSGASGSPVTLDGSGATYAGGINTANQSWWRVQNVTWSTAYTGYLVTVVGGSNGVINHNTADNIQHGIFLSQYNGAVLPSNITVSNNWLRQTAADLGNTQHDIITTEGSANVVIDGNYLELRTGGAGNEAHNDGIQTYQKGGASGGPPSNWTIRYNKIVMNSAATNDRSWMMLENLKGTVNIHDNLLLGLNGASAANGIAADSNDAGVVFNIFNNTFVSKGDASNNILNLYAPGVANIRNNIISSVSQTALHAGMTVNRDHNLWIGSNIPSCSGVTGEMCGVDPHFTDYTNNNFTPLDSSPTLTAGANLGTTFGKVLAKDAAWPQPLELSRATTGNWSMGAIFNQGSTVSLPSPTSLRVVN
jgi:hypothetical protein